MKLKRGKKKEEVKYKRTENKNARGNIKGF